jgi:hypothetical protein
MPYAYSFLPDNVTPEKAEEKHGEQSHSGRQKDGK